MSLFGRLHLQNSSISQRMSSDPSSLQAFILAALLSPVCDMLQPRPIIGFSLTQLSLAHASCPPSQTYKGRYGYCCRSCRVLRAAVSPLHDVHGLVGPESSPVQRCHNCSRRDCLEALALAPTGPLPRPTPLQSEQSAACVDGVLWPPT